MEYMSSPRVLSVTKGSPAESAQIFEGDEFLSINGRRPRDIIEYQLLVEEVNVTFEDEYFPPPPELRDLLRTISDAVSLALVAPNGKDYPVDNDRNVKASDILERLTANS